MSKLWKQVRIVQIGDLIFDNEQLDVEFDVKCTDDNASDIATIKIYNLSEITKNKLATNQIITIDSGYRELHGIIFAGLLETKKTERENNDLVTVITASPNNRAYTNTIVNKQFQKNIKASEVLKNLEKIIPFKIDIKGLKRDITYVNGKAFSNRLSNVIDILARDTGTIARFTSDTIEFKEANKTYSSSIKLASKQGLIRVEKYEDKADIKDKKNKKQKEKYKIEALLVPLIKIGQQLEIESMEWTGKGVVKECNYIAQGAEAFTVNAIVEVV